MIAREAGEESPLWRSALRPAGEREETPVFSPLAADEFALGLEAIYEGYLLHYGRPRLFTTSDRDTAVLLGDYLYAHGLVRIAELGNVEVVADLAELISVCAHLRVEGAPGDGAAWASAVALLGRWRDADGPSGDAGSWLESAESGASPEAVAHSLALHAERFS